MTTLCRKFGFYNDSDGQGRGYLREVRGVVGGGVVGGRGDREYLLVWTITLRVDS